MINFYLANSMKTAAEACGMVVKLSGQGHTSESVSDFV